MNGSSGDGRQPLVAAFDLLLLDLDGVVYLGDEPAPAAVESLGELRDRGVALHFVTNNARRTAGAVAERLRALGVAASEAEVTTSAQGAGDLLARRYPPGSGVLVVGSAALAGEVRNAGMVPTASADEAPAAVVQGYAPEIGWSQLAEAAVAIRTGAEWIATNLDVTLPSERGALPGNGALVGAVGAALGGREPDLVVGKPEPALFEQATRRRGARRPLVVGDRLDTDIEGANRAGLPSLAVLTGVATPAEVVAATLAQRPSFVAADLSALLRPDQAPTVERDGVRSAGWRVRRVGETAELTSTSAAPSPAIDALPAVCAVVWRSGAVLRAADPAAVAALAELGLDG